MIDPNTELTEEQQVIKEELEARNRENAEKQKEKQNQKEYLAYLDKLGIPSL